MKGRKPKPTAMKILSNNPGKRPLNKKEPAYPVLGDRPPDFLGDIAKEEWSRMFPLLFSAMAIKATEAANLAAYCESFETYQRLAELSRGKGFVVKAPNGCPMISPLFTALSRARADMLRCMAELGITPSSRSRVVAEGHCRDKNPFEDV
ncbi:MAG TPA: phage terminase small subunit P27 family [Alphaproteobacteria bacterium]|nr:phage terminase small subunit P27 family [Alphaproteobacteria bacterium]